MWSKQLSRGCDVVNPFRVLGIPEGSAMTLFVLGRTVGWIGHVIEQYEVDQLIRPWAKYVGI